MLPARRTITAPSGTRHPRADRCAGRQPAAVVHNAGYQRAALPGHADAGDTDPLFAAVFLHQHTLRFNGIPAPQVGGIAQLGPFGVGIQVNRPVALAGEKNGVDPAPLDGGSQVASAIGIAPGAGERAFANDHPTTGEQGTAGRQYTGHESQDIVRPQGVRLGWNPSVQQPCGQTGAG